jgi:hypothetical protein
MTFEKASSLGKNAERRGMFFRLETVRVAESPSYMRERWWSVRRGPTGVLKLIPFKKGCFFKFSIPQGEPGEPNLSSGVNIKRLSIKDTASTERYSGKSISFFKIF